MSQMSLMGLGGESYHQRLMAAREAGGPLSWKHFCSSRKWFVQSDKEKTLVREDGTNVNCASLLDGGVLRWSEDEESDAQYHQITCIRRGEVIAVSEFATARFHPFLDLDFERLSEPDGDEVGIFVARLSQREMRKFLDVEETCSRANSSRASGKSKSVKTADVLKAVVLLAPPKCIQRTTAANKNETWYKRGFHIVFPNIVLSVYEWRHFLAAVAFACHSNSESMRDGITCSDWLRSVDVACGPNLRAPFSDKKSKCFKCHAARKQQQQQQQHGKNRQGLSHAAQDAVVISWPARDRKRQRADGECAAAEHTLEDVDMRMLTSSDAPDAKEMLKMLKQVRTPEGRNRNSCSACDDAQCVDGYIPEHRPYTIMAILHGNGKINAVETEHHRTVSTASYALSTIRAPLAKQTSPAFHLYEGAVSVRTVLEMAGKDWSRVVGIPHNQAASAACSPGLRRKLSGRTMIHDDGVIKCMLHAAQKLHPCFRAIIPEKAYTNAARSYAVLVVTGEDSRRCLNLQPGRLEVDSGAVKHVLKGGDKHGHGSLPGLHRSPNKAHFYFCAHTGSVSQRCSCMCTTHEGRATAAYCKDYKSEKMQLSAGQRLSIFGSAGTKEEESAEQIVNKFAVGTLGQNARTSTAAAALPSAPGVATNRLRAILSLSHRHDRQQRLLMRAASTSRDSVNAAVDDNGIGDACDSVPKTARSEDSLDVDSSYQTDDGSLTTEQALSVAHRTATTAIEDMNKGSALSVSTSTASTSSSRCTIIIDYLDTFMKQQQEQQEQKQQQQ